VIKLIEYWRKKEEEHELKSYGPRHMRTTCLVSEDPLDFWPVMLEYSTTNTLHLWDRLNPQTP